MQDHRSVPLEVLRDFVRARAELSSLRDVAAQTGLGRTTLHSFINGETKPHPRVRRAMGLWYFAKMNEAPDIDIVRPYEAAISVLLAALPDAERGTARALVIDDLRSPHAQTDTPLPRWLELLQSTLNGK